MFQQICKKLESYSKLNNSPTVPTFCWCSKTFCDVLLQYPAGLTEAVLLTELEVRWRLYLRRGENRGKLLQVLTSKQLSSDDVLIGDVTSADTVDDSDVKSGKYLMRSMDGGKVDLLLHEQFTDFIGFTKHEGMSSLFKSTKTGTCRWMA